MAGSADKDPRGHQVALGNCSGDPLSMPLGRPYMGIYVYRYMYIYIYIYTFLPLMRSGGLALRGMPPTRLTTTE